MNQKLKIIINELLMPLVIYIGISLFVRFAGAVFLKEDSKINSVIQQSIANIILLIIFIPLYFKDKKPIIDKDTFNLRKFIYLIPLSFSLCVICNLSISIFFDISKNSVSNAVADTVNENGYIVAIFAVAIIVPFIEEILFRGFFFDGIEKLLNPIWGGIVSSILFALIHGNIEQVIYAFFAGIVLSYIRFKYGSVFYSIFMHLFMNLSSMIFMPSFTLIENTRNKLFMILIMTVIFLLTLYRINDNNINIFGRKK